jgi:mannose-6-phosphate isomerase-like protein (cupin superfamily)
MTDQTAEIRVIRNRDLEPAWTVYRAKEPGFMRSLITWVGGPEGHVNTNRGSAVESLRGIVGLMRMPVGNRQAGVHVHSITEIYVILKGEVESFDGDGNTHRAGPMDCLYIPAGVPHGVRAVGDTDLELIWLHDAIEREGVSRYLEGSGPFPSEDEVSLISFADLVPSWSGAAAGSLSWSARWVVAAGSAPGVSAQNALIEVGVSVIPAWNAPPPETVDCDCTFVVMRGEAIATLQGKPQALGRLDAFHCAAGSRYALRNPSEEALWVLWSRDLPITGG